MTTAQDPETTGAAGSDLGWIAWAIIGVLLILCVIGLITYSGQKQTAQAEAKAQELTARYDAAGLTAPNQKILVRTLGTDGGNICANPANSLGIALLKGQLSNGAAQVGVRPVIADPISLKGQRIILEVYCPDELAELVEKIEDFKTDNTIEG